MFKEIMHISISFDFSLGLDSDLNTTLIFGFITIMGNWNQLQENLSS